MKIHITCTKCVNKSLERKPYLEYSKVCSISDDGIYKFECPNGHQTVTVLRTPKHEVLYTIGVNALLDGYFRESISSFSVSLERYYEFALRVIARSKDIEPDKFQQIWKLISKQSERQFGAFVIAYLLETGLSYTSVSQNHIDKMTKLRNDVVHQGKIPSYQECINYGQYVIDIITPIEQNLLKNYGGHHKKECFALAAEVRKHHPEPLGVLSMVSYFSVAMKNNGQLEPTLECLRKNRKFEGTPMVESEYFKSTVVIPAHYLKT
jgi:hypothetical protein